MAEEVGLRFPLLHSVPERRALRFSLSLPPRRLLHQGILESNLRGFSPTSLTFVIAVIYSSFAESSRNIYT